MMKAAIILIFFALIATVSEGRGRSRIIPRPAQPLSSLKINETHLNERASSCSFTVSIRTSCSSVRYTRDRISLSFGDAYGNQVYAPRLDEPGTRTFERCSTDTFQINGPCTYQICYLYLYRSGKDGWRPYDVTVSGYNTSPVTFYYDVVIPRDTWYGFNNCNSYAAAAKFAMKK
ncbi:hypothetical protein ACH5RR_024599 [Cinchona calisaya]|uniref:Embryo-specific 3 n=1 Tax=Cinchona calisaya TaxID=153742 RepID=A0ABD2Z0C7_9GENT